MGVVLVGFHVPTTNASLLIWHIVFNSLRFAFPGQVLAVLCYFLKTDIVLPLKNPVNYGIVTKLGSAYFANLICVVVSKNIADFYFETAYTGSFKTYLV